MPILIDGNNLLHRLPRSSRSREGVRRKVLDQTRSERVTVYVVFDGNPDPGVPRREFLGNVSLEYAGSLTADDVIISRIPKSPSARSWVVVTDDRGLSNRARELGASVRSLSAWMSRRGARRKGPRPDAGSRLSAKEIAEWEEFFSSQTDESRDG